MDRRINESPMYDIAARAMLGVAVVLWATAGIIDEWVDVKSVQNDTSYDLDRAGKITSPATPRTEHFGIFKSELKGVLSGKSNWTVVFNDCQNGFDVGVFVGSEEYSTSSGCETQCYNKKWLFWVSLIVAGIAFVGSGNMATGYMRGRDEFFPRVAAFVMLLFVVGTSWYLYGIFSMGLTSSVSGHGSLMENADGAATISNSAGTVIYPADFGICE